MVYGEQFMKAIHYPDNDTRVRGLKYIDRNLKTLLYCCDVKDFHVFENENNRWHPEAGSGGRLYLFFREIAPLVCAYLISGQQHEFGKLLIRLVVTPDLEYLALQDHAYFNYNNHDRFELRLKLPHEVHVLGRIIQLIHKYSAYKPLKDEQNIEAILRFGRAAMRFGFMYNPSSFISVESNKDLNAYDLKTNNFSDVRKSLLQESLMTQSMLNRKPDWQNQFYRKNFYIVKNEYKNELKKFKSFDKEKKYKAIVNNSLGNSKISPLDAYFAVSPKELDLNVPNLWDLSFEFGNLQFKNYQRLSKETRKFNKNGNNQFDEYIQNNDLIQCYEPNIINYKKNYVRKFIEKIEKSLRMQMKINKNREVSNEKLSIMSNKLNSSISNSEKIFT